VEPIRGFSCLVGAGGNAMYRRMLQGRPLLVVAVLALGVSLSMPSAGAAASRASARPGRFIPPTLRLAPCTKPLLGSNKNCESTSPKVDRWWKSTAAAASCSIKFNVSWNDGTSSTRTFTDAPKGSHLIASHTYHGYTTYSEVVTSSVISGTCTPIPTTDFEITHVPDSLPSWLAALGIRPACFKDLIPDPVDIGLKEKDLNDTLGLFKIGKKLGALFRVVERANDLSTAYTVLFEMPFDCAVQASVVPDASGRSIPGILGALPQAYAYGAHHPGKLFKPSGKVPPQPRITAVSGYQKGSLVYFTIFYANPGNAARGFGFVGINGTGLAQENHSFTHPSFGIVGHDRISYPFNLGCGTSPHRKSWVAAWIYNKAHIRSQDVKIALDCTP
jgi:hypothetical protein